MAVYYGSLPPDSSEVFWVNTNTTPFKLMQWTGSEWCLVTTVETAVFDLADVPITDVPVGHYAVDKAAGSVRLVTETGAVVIGGCSGFGGGT